MVRRLPLAAATDFVITSVFERIFDRFGDLRLDDLRIGTGIDRTYRNNRDIDVRDKTHREPLVTYYPDQQDDEVQYGGEHRPAYGYIG